MRPAVRAALERAPLAVLAARPSYLWFVVGTVCIGAFMGQLDAGIAQLVLPTLQAQFAVSLASISWVALVYLLVLAAALPIFGRLADLYGRKLLYTLGFLVFIVGSGLCGFAGSLAALLAARVLQAVGAAMLQANSVAIITAAAGPARRGRALGVQGAAQAVGLAFGPALGGLLIQTLGWRWIFWINVPAGLLGMFLGWFVLPRTAGLAADARGFDWKGALLLAPGLAALLLALSELPNWGGSARFFGVAALGIACLAGFVVHERRAGAPLVDLSLFASRGFRAGNLAGLISYALLFGVFLIAPYALERGYRETPLAAGLRLTVIPLALAVAAPFAGALSDRFGARRLTVGGMLLAAAALGALALSLDGRTATLAILTAAFAAFGIGQGAFTAPNNSAIMGSAPPGRLGAAGGVLNVMRALGTSLGVALGASLLAWRIGIFGTAGGDTLSATAATVVAGSRETLLALAALALVAAAISALRERTAATVG
ncbi:MAG: DHA2 family efflux MFS transporter permease subunit [Vulcanimicrobiaceae bacterium]